MAKRKLTQWYRRGTWWSRLRLNRRYKDILLKEKAEVTHMLLTEYDEKRHLRNTFLEGREDGLKEGRKDGLREGLKRGREEGV